MAKRKLRLQYIGLRLNAIGEDPKHAFHHGKRTLYWKRLAYPIVGSFYEAEQEGQETTLAIRQSPKNPPDSFVIPQEWIDSDTAAREFLKKRRERERAKRLVGTMWPEVRPLHLRAKKLGIFERTKFAEAVARMIVTGKFVFLVTVLSACGGIDGERGVQPSRPGPRPPQTQAPEFFKWDLPQFKGGE